MKIHAKHFLKMRSLTIQVIFSEFLYRKTDYAYSEFQVEIEKLSRLAVIIIEQAA
jgi:hypothetical protein